MMRLGLVLKCAAAALLVALSAARADEADFFRGRTITLYIGTGPGGGYDAYGRLVARHIGRMLPGTPGVVVQNMPGASSLVLTNFLYNKAPRDGTAIAVINQAMPMEQYLQTEGIAYDANKFNWIGRVTSAAETGIVWHTVPVNRIEDVFTRETVVGGTGPTSSTVFVPYLLNNLVGTKFKVITGFTGTNEIGLAMERGEVEGSGTPLESLKSYRANWMRDHKIKILLLWSAHREPELPGVPSMVELGRDEESRKILKFYASADDIGRSVVAPPGLPPERVAAIRHAFNALTTDARFLEDAAHAGLEVKPLSGEKLQAMVGEVANFPKSLIGKARAARRGPK
jgi:tripartite-type tricarboxylate transporter receptor subunit TctC